MRHGWLGQARVIRPVVANFRFVLGSSFCPFWMCIFVFVGLLGIQNHQKSFKKDKMRPTSKKCEKVTKKVYNSFCFGLHFWSQKLHFFVILAPGRISEFPLKSAPRPLLLESAPERSWGVPASILSDFGFQKRCPPFSGVFSETRKRHETMLFTYFREVGRSRNGLRIDA